MSHHTYNLHLCNEPHVHVDCADQGEPRGKTYPVLHIDDATIFPSREQLVAIRDAIQGYLDAHPVVLVAGTPTEDQCMKLVDVDIAQPRELTDAEVQEMF